MLDLLKLFNIKFWYKKLFIKKGCLFLNKSYKFGIDFEDKVID